MKDFPYPVLLFPGILFPVILLIFEKRQDMKKALLFKALSSAVFVALGFLASRGRYEERFTVLILIGLVCGFIGDVLLSLRHVLKERMSLFFIGGGFFFVGHLCYLAALTGEFGRSPRLLFAAVPAALAASAVLIVLLLRRIQADKRFSVLMACYMLSVVSMAVMAVFRAISAGFSLPSLFFMTGAVFFAASDTILVENMWNPEWSYKKCCALIALYYAAQLLIAMSLGL